MKPARKERPFSIPEIQARTIAVFNGVLKFSYFIFIVNI